MCRFSVGDKIRNIKNSKLPMLVVCKITHIFGDEVYCLSRSDGLKIPIRDSIKTTYSTDRDYEKSQVLSW